MRAWIFATISASACAGGAMAPAQPPDAAPAAADASPPAVTYPDPDWATGTPESQGLDGGSLAQAIAAADAADSYCLLVIRHGVLVSETYFHDATAASTPSSWSIAKSYTATTVGIAIGNHDLPALDSQVSEVIPTWQGSARDAVTWRHLVTMTSGLQWSVLRDYIEMAELAPDKSSFAVGDDASSPAGSTWVYNNSAVQVIEPAFRAAAHTSIEDYARAHLWQPIGMSASWAHDAVGHPTTYANVLATCRDHARLGYLYLHHGRWKDAQVVPAEWVTAATTPSNPYNQGYGYLFWLNGHAPTISSLGTQSAGELYDYAPADLFGAHGFGTQFIEVIPSLDMVIVRFGRDPTASLSTDPAEVAKALIADELSDTRKKILAPIFAAVRN